MNELLRVVLCFACVRAATTRSECFSRAVNIDKYGSVVQICWCSLRLDYAHNIRHAFYPPTSVSVFGLGNFQQREDDALLAWNNGTNTSGLGDLSWGSDRPGEALNAAEEGGGRRPPNARDMSEKVDDGTRRYGTTVS